NLCVVRRRGGGKFDGVVWLLLGLSATSGSATGTELESLTAPLSLRHGHSWEIVESGRRRRIQGVTRWSHSSNRLVSPWSLWPLPAALCSALGFCFRLRQRNRPTCTTEYRARRKDRPLLLRPKPFIHESGHSTAVSWSGS